MIEMMVSMLESCANGHFCYVQTVFWKKLSFSANIGYSFFSKCYYEREQTFQVAGAAIFQTITYVDKNTAGSLFDLYPFI